MDAISMLYNFAKQEGIDSQRVDAFLNQFKDPQTLEELMNLPHDMLKHFNFINDVDGPLYKYIKSRERHRYEVVTLDDLGDELLDNKYYYEEKLLKEDADVEKITKELEQIDAVIAQMIRIKFGSIEIDW